MATSLTKDRKLSKISPNYNWRNFFELDAIEQKKFIQDLKENGSKADLIALEAVLAKAIEIQQAAIDKQGKRESLDKSADPSLLRHASSLNIMYDNSRQHNNQSKTLQKSHSCWQGFIKLICG